MPTQSYCCAVISPNDTSWISAVHPQDQSAACEKHILKIKKLATHLCIVYASRQCTKNTTYSYTLSIHRPQMQTDVSYLLHFSQTFKCKSTVTLTIFILQKYIFSATEKTTTWHFGISNNSETHSAWTRRKMSFNVFDWLSVVEVLVCQKYSKLWAQMKHLNVLPTV